jgi:hypothetical protein
VTAARCQGKRQMWRNHRFGTFKCGNKATWIVTTQVGTSQRHYCCDDCDCYRSIAQGYPTSNTQINQTGDSK